MCSPPGNAWFRQATGHHVPAQAVCAGRTAAKQSHPSWLGRHIQRVPLCVRLSGEKERGKLETDGQNDTHRPGIHGAGCRVQTGA